MKLESNSTLFNFIKTYDNVFSEEECKNILDEYSSSDEWNVATTEGNVDNYRVCEDLDMSGVSSLNKNPDVRYKLDILTYRKVHSCAEKYKDEFGVRVDGDSGYNLLRYNDGGYHRSHTDDIKSAKRILSMSIVLNDNYEGGELSFFDDGYVIPPKVGSVVIFPSNFMFPHEVKTVNNGTRYAIVTWLR